MIEDIDFFLKENGFRQAELSMTPANWGDAFYIREK